MEADNVPWHMCAVDSADGLQLLQSLWVCGQRKNVPCYLDAWMVSHVPKSTLGYGFCSFGRIYWCMKMYIQLAAGYFWADWKFQGGIELGLEMHIQPNYFVECRCSECTGLAEYIAYLHIIGVHFVYWKMIILPGDQIFRNESGWTFRSKWAQKHVFWIRTEGDTAVLSSAHFFPPGMSNCTLGWAHILWPDFQAMIDDCTFCSFGWTYCFHLEFPIVHHQNRFVLPGDRICSR